MEDSEFGRKLKVIASLLMIVIGIAFYWGYGIAYGEWNILSAPNEGVYSIIFFFLGVGIIGFLLFRKKSPAI